MSLPIIFRRDARKDFDQAHDWYDKQKAGLGEEFSDSVNKVLERIAAHPQLHQCVYKDARRASWSGFRILFSTALNEPVFAFWQSFTASGIQRSGRRGPEGTANHLGPSNSKRKRHIAFRQAGINFFGKTL